MSGYEHEHEHGHFMPHSHSHRHQGEQPTEAHERSGMGPHHHTHAALTRREPLARAIGDSGAEASADVDAAWAVLRDAMRYDIDEIAVDDHRPRIEAAIRAEGATDVSADVDAAREALLDLIPHPWQPGLMEAFIIFEAAIRAKG